MAFIAVVAVSRRQGAWGCVETPAWAGDAQWPDSMQSSGQTPRQSQVGYKRQGRPGKYLRELFSILAWRKAAIKVSRFLSSFISAPPKAASEESPWRVWLFALHFEVMAPLLFDLIDSNAVSSIKPTLPGGALGFNFQWLSMMKCPSKIYEREVLSHTFSLSSITEFLFCDSC